jgi:hypothetical protein
VPESLPDCHREWAMVGIYFKTNYMPEVSGAFAPVARTE